MYTAKHALDIEAPVVCETKVKHKRSKKSIDTRKKRRGTMEYKETWIVLLYFFRVFKIVLHGCILSRDILTQKHSGMSTSTTQHTAQCLTDLRAWLGTCDHL